MNSEFFDLRANKLRALMGEHFIDVAVITDPDSVYYFTGFFDYLFMDFGRPTVLVIPRDGDAILVTPSIEFEMATRMTSIADIRAWQDGVGEEWRGPLASALKGADERAFGLDVQSAPAVVRQYIDAILPSTAVKDVALLIADMRMIKSTEEIQLARHAGKVANAMMAAAHGTIAEGVPEYELAIAAMNAGTREAAGILNSHYAGSLMSPNAHFLQIMASGRDITMPHHRATTRKLERGDPVFFCFCGMTNFHRFKLGFDRTFWLGHIEHDAQRKMYEIAVASQAAALKVLRPGISAEDVHAEYAEVIQAAGYDFPFRCGRATGNSFLEKPQLASGDKTILQENMVLAVDGSVAKSGFFRAQVGDSVVITKDGYELLTSYSKAVNDVVVA
jgi:Xaa-Pro dipeptidase